MKGNQVYSSPLADYPPATVGNRSPNHQMGREIYDFYWIIVWPFETTWVCFFLSLLSFTVFQGLPWFVVAVRGLQYSTTFTLYFLVWIQSSSTMSHWDKHLFNSNLSIFCSTCGPPLLFLGQVPMNALIQ